MEAARRRRVQLNEDALTSMVFDVLQHCEPGLYLRRAQPLPPMEIVHGTLVRFDYWPWWSGIEPDAALTIDTPDGESVLIAIEAKWRSGKSGHEDQLARQASARPDIAGILYITAHSALPSAELDESYAAMDRHVPIWWLTWRDLVPILEGVASDNPVLNYYAAQAAGALRAWGLDRFRGISIPTACPPYRLGQSMADHPDGREILGALRSVQRLHQEVSQLLREAESYVQSKRRRMRPASYDRTVGTGWGSKLDSPLEWMPRYFARWLIERDNAVFISVLLSNLRLGEGEPLLTAGWLKGVDAISGSDWYKAARWLDLDLPANGALYEDEQGVYVALPLVTIRTIADLESLLDQVLARMAGEGQPTSKVAEPPH